MLYTTAGVAAAGVTGYVALETDLFFEKEKEVIVQTEPAAEETEVAKLTTEPQAEPEQPAVIEPEPILPVFSVLRVENDGSVVVAGEGPGDSEVTLFNGESNLGITQSGPEGDFVFVLDKPLAPGSHELTLRAKPKDQEAVFSAEAGLINIPEPETEEEATVLVAESGEATRILQKPKTPEVEEEILQEVVEEVAEEPAEEVVETAEAEVEAEPEVAVEVDEPTQEVAAVEEPEPKPVVVKPVLVEAADIEGEKLFIAGTGEPGKKVNIYLDSKLLGTTGIGDNGAFLYDGSHKIDAGNYTVRADMVEPDEGNVLARAEVKLVHEPEVQVTAVEEKPVEQEVTEEVVEEEPTQEVVEAEVEVTAEVVKPEPKEIRTGTAVIIRRGDSLWRVARRNYGAGIRYTTIFDANRDQIRDPNLIYPGQVLKVPEGESAEDTSTNG